MPLERDHGARRVLVEHGPDAAQVAEPLLADRRGQQDRDEGCPAGSGEVAAELDQRRDGHAVVTDARPVQAAAVAPRLERRAGREDRVQVCGDDDRWARGTDAGEHVAGRVDGRLKARPGQQRGDGGRAVLLPERGRGDGTEGEGVADEIVEHGGGGSGAAPPRYAADSSRGAAIRLMAASLLVASSAATLYDSASVG